MLSLPDPNSSIVLIQPAAAPGTVTEFKLSSGICADQRDVAARVSPRSTTHRVPRDTLRSQMLKRECFRGSARSIDPSYSLGLGVVEQAEDV